MIARKKKSIEELAGSPSSVTRLQAETILQDPTLQGQQKNSSSKSLLTIGLAFVSLLGIVSTTVLTSLLITGQTFQGEIVQQISEAERVQAEYDMQLKGFTEKMNRVSSGYACEQRANQRDTGWLDALTDGAANIKRWEADSLSQDDKSYFFNATREVILAVQASETLSEIVSNKYRNKKAYMVTYDDAGNKVTEPITPSEYAAYKLVEYIAVKKAAECNTEAFIEVGAITSEIVEAEEDLQTLKARLFYLAGHPTVATQLQHLKEIRQQIKARELADQINGKR
ncbi:MAG: hypothetical protein F6J98_01980 [Moorea sp. SIO4G2]|nr:hypothetical protein [Moorena sp. SIO4G2]